MTFARWIGLATLLIVGCGEDPSKLPDGGGSDGGGSDGGHADAGRPDAGLTGLDGSPLRCGAAAAEPHGFERCETGALRRIAPSTCPSSVPRVETIVSNFPGIDACDHDSDCSDLPLGYCGQREGGTANACIAGCTEDSDCAAGRVCLCGEPAGRCIPADCTSNADCEQGYDCVLYNAPDGCLPQRLACQTPNDQCAGGRGCAGYSVNATFCVRGAESSECSITQCTQP